MSAHIIGFTAFVAALGLPGLIPRRRYRVLVCAVLMGVAGGVGYGVLPGLLAFSAVLWGADMGKTL